MLFLLSLLALINAEKEVGWFGALNHLMNNKECTVDDCIAPCQVDHHGARRGEKWCKVAKEAKCKDQQWEALYGDFSYQACKETCVCIDKCVRDNFGHDAGRSWCKVAQNSGCGDEKFKVLWGHYSYEACEAQGVTAETSGYVAPPEEAEETAAPVVATPEPTTLDPTEATQEPTSPYFLAEAAAYTCPEGSGTVDEADCEAVAAGLATSPAGRSLRKGSGGSCAGWSWGSVPVGCSLQSGGDNTAHYKSGGVTGPGCVKDKFQLVCEYGKENIDLELKTFALSLDSSTQMAVNGFAAIGLGFLLYGAAKFYLVKSQDEVAYSEI